MVAVVVLGEEAFCRGGALRLRSGAAAAAIFPLLRRSPLPGPLPGHLGDDHFPFAFAQGGLHRVGEAGADVRLDHQAVDDELDAVLHLLVELDRLVEEVLGAVDAHAGEAALLGAVEDLGVLALALADLGRQEQDPAALGAPEDRLDDLVGAAPPDLAAAAVAVLHADARPQHAQVVVHLGDGADGRARIARRRLLLDGDGRRQAADRLVLRLVELAEELAGVAAQRLDVAALALGVDGVEGERALARAAGPGEHHQLALGHIQVDVLEVVLGGATDLDAIELGGGQGGATIIEREPS